MVEFSRPTNFYWFTMFQKLMDPGVNYEYLKADTIGDNFFDVIKISFSTEDGKPTDIYQVYVNQTTKLIDQFLFTVAAYNVMETPLLMQVEYTEVDGMLLPAIRKYKKSNWNADVLEGPWITATWSDIKFNNGLTKEDFTKK